MESWRKVFRRGVLPQLSTRCCEKLRDGLLVDDERIIQGATTSPPPLQCVRAWPCEAACLLGYAGWQGEGLETVADVEKFFATVCAEADRLLGEKAGIRHLLNWFDETPRDIMRRQLLAELNRHLAGLPVISS